MITDSVRYPKAPKVRKWLKKATLLIELHFLRARSPNGNAVEYGRRKTNQMVVHYNFYVD